MALTFGVKLGPYQIESRLGAGGAGEVYRARDARLHRTVAIKIPTQGVADTREVRQRFLVNRYAKPAQVAPLHIILNATAAVTK
jgi:serine/threonine protein kinase